MERLKLKFSEINLSESVSSLLKGHVFHVTKLDRLGDILKCGEIRPNVDGQFKTTFGSSINSFFRKRGCISLFDYRNIDPEIFKIQPCKCSPTQPATPESGIAVLFVSEKIHSKLISWELWHTEGQNNEMIVPHDEIGHKGPIKIENIFKIIEITVTEDPTSLARMLLNARKSG